MVEYLREILATDGFHPHGYCYLWKPGLVWLHVVSDSLIGLAYVAIGATLALFVQRGSGMIPFSRVFVAFGVFIAACGATHFMEIWTLWNPVYWLSGSVKVVTAAASVVTAVALPPLIPIALTTIRAARLSERRKDELEQVNDRLAATHGELQELYERLKEADEAKTRFFANISHELRTPLALILGPTESLLQRPRLADEERQQLESVQRNAALLLKHVNDLLDVQKVGAGRMRVRYAAADLAALVRFWAGHFETVAEQRGISYSLETPPSLAVETDPDKLGRILLNLLANAFKFTPDGGRVRCLLRLEGEPGARSARGRIEVHDSGPGIPPEQREVIFQPFRQLEDAPTRRYGGTGLGLAIVHEFTELLGGSVAVGESPEGGAAFVLELPLEAPPGAEVEELPSGPAASAAALALAELVRTAAPTPREEAAGDASRPLVLVVEDNPEMSGFVAASLRPEFRVEVAGNGAEGFEKARRLVPDLILSDLMMPVATGDVLLREVRAVSELDAVPFLLLSARADDELRLRLLREGAQDYLIKPFAVDELRARVRNWVSMKRARDMLRHALQSTVADVEALAREITTKQRELDTALTATRLALADAEAANRAKADFLSVMSHELRTPLNAIIGYTELLALEGEESLPEPQRVRIERIRTNSVHLLRMVEEVLTFTRAESGQQTVHTEEFELAAALTEATEALRPAAEARDLRLELTLPEDPLPIVGDSDVVRQIFTSVLENAIKFTEHGGVTVTAEPSAGEALIRVTDTGPGIAPEHREKVFEPFWQADLSKTRRVGGTGLGLAIAQRLAMLIGGEVRLGRSSPVGTQFVIRLPLEPPRPAD